MTLTYVDFLWILPFLCKRTTMLSLPKDLKKIIYFLNPRFYWREAYNLRQAGKQRVLYIFYIITFSSFVAQDYT